jgi:tetratricopeptide (TPR) repeat protein
MKFILTVLLIFLFFSLNYGQGLKYSFLNSDKSSTIILEELVNKDPDKYKIEIHKLEKQLKESRDNKALTDLYLFHAEHLLYQGKYDSSLTILHKARKLQSNPSHNSLLPIYLQLGILFHYKANIDSLTFWQEKAKNQLTSGSPYYGQFLLNEGLKSQLNSDYKKAIKVIIEAASLFEKNNDLKKLALAYNNLGFNYERLGDLETNVKYLLKAVDLNKRMGNSYNLALNYNNLGLSYRQKGQPEEAVKYYDLAFNELQKVKSPMLLAQNLMNRANIFRGKGNLAKAESLFLQSLAICNKNNIEYGKMLCILNLGNLYREQQRFELALDYLWEAFKLSQTLKTRREEALIYERFSWLSRDRGNYKEAYEWQSKFYALNDSLVNESVKKEANALLEKFETEKKEKEILSLSKQKLYQQLVIAGLAIGLLVLLVIIQWWRSKHKLDILEKQKQELQRKHLRDILESKDKELTAQAAQLIQMRQLLDTAKENVADILNDSSLEQAKVKKIKAALNKNSVMEVKNEFDLRITSSNRDFFNTLLKTYPELKPSELKLCAYLRLNLSTKEIAEIINNSVRTVETIRLSIRKKMGLDHSDNLVAHLISVEMNY